MNFVDRVAEARIKTAADNGAFDDLPGAGQPLPPDDARHVPAELRAAYRLLRNGGFLPPEVTRARDINALRDLLTRLDPGSVEADTVTRRLRWLEVTLASSRRGQGLLSAPGYGARVRACLAREK